MFDSDSALSLLLVGIAAFAVLVAMKGSTTQKALVSAWLLAP